ncbi:MAG: ABC transporter, permease protein 2 (cluster 11, riboflavin/purine nucleoside/unknown), partial [uncultured Truepera sp.]
DRDGAAVNARRVGLAGDDAASPGRARRHVQRACRRGQYRPRGHHLVRRARRCCSRPLRRAARHNSEPASRRRLRAVARAAGGGGGRRRSRLAARLHLDPLQGRSGHLRNCDQPYGDRAPGGYPDRLIRQLVEQRAHPQPSAGVGRRRDVVQPARLLGVRAGAGHVLRPLSHPLRVAAARGRRASRGGGQRRRRCPADALLRRRHLGGPGGARRRLFEHRQPQPVHLGDVGWARLYRAGGAYLRQVAPARRLGRDAAFRRVRGGGDAVGWQPADAADHRTEPSLYPDDVRAGRVYRALGRAARYRQALRQI